MTKKEKLTVSNVESEHRPAPGILDPRQGIFDSPGLESLPRSFSVFGNSISGNFVSTLVITHGVLAVDHASRAYVLCNPHTEASALTQ